MHQEVYEEKMTEKELAFIQAQLDKDAVGYFKLLRLMFIVALIVIIVVGLVASLVRPENDLEKKFSLSSYIFSSSVAILFLLGATIYGKKKFSSKYKADLKHRIKRIFALQIQHKQYVPMTQTCHFHLNYPGLNSIQVSQEDFNNYQVGDLIHIEFAKFSQTYLGYF